MKEEYITPPERVEAAINLEQPDRVPINLVMSAAFASRYFGESLADMHKDPLKGLDAMVRLYEDFGGWDGYNVTPNAKVVYSLGGFKVKVPGQELPENYVMQFDEGEWMKVEDYKTVARKGWTRFCMEEYIFRITDITPKNLQENLMIMVKMLKQANYEWNKKRNVGIKLCTAQYHPFFALSLSRSLIKFTEDLYRRPALVEAALDTMTDEVIKNTITVSKRTGAKIVFIPEERAEGAIYPLKIFERFWWPYTKRIVEALFDKGIRVWFHLD